LTMVKIHYEEAMKRFVHLLETSLTREQVFNKIIKEVEESSETWDKVARKIIGDVVRRVYNQLFPEGKLKEAVYVEGQGTPIAWRRPYNLFGSEGIYPDIAILKPVRIAIELDHSGAGHSAGSRFKMALAKASFAYLSGDWDYCIVLFHNHSGRLMKPYLSREREKEVLRLYEEHLNTRVILYEGSMRV